MRAFVMVATFFVVEAAWAVPATADPVLVRDGGGNVTDILSLDVNGDLYNVRFVADSFLGIWGGPADPNPVPTFWNDSMSARAAHDAIRKLLGSTESTAGGSTDGFMIPFEGIGSANVRYWIDGNLAGGIDFGFNQVRSATDDEVVNPKAVFSPVPEPSSIALLAVAAAGLLCVRRSRHRASASSVRSCP